MCNIPGSAAAAATTARYYSTQQSNPDVSRFVCSSHGVSTSVVPAHGIKFKPGTINIDFGIPTRPSVLNIIEMPVARIPPLQEPTKNQPTEYDSPLPQTSVDLPTVGNNLEKQAVRMIIIRHKKMKKHKRRKLRKKMKFVWAKLRHKRNLQKIKRFESAMIAKIKEAQAFDAKEYVQGRLNILNKERIPRVYRGELIPQEMIKKFLDEKKAKREARCNKPRLTL